MTKILHVPERTCVACRQTGSKRKLVRLVRTPAGNVEIDPDSKKPGRGAYLCNTKECWDLALKKGLRNRLAYSLKAEISPENQAALMEYGITLHSSETAGQKGIG